MFGFWMHFFIVLLCIGVGVTGKIIFDNLWALDNQIKRMNAEHNATKKITSDSKMVDSPQICVTLII